MDIPCIHYVWVGSPTQSDPSAIAGHDIAGPILMAEALNKQQDLGELINPIKFWCLYEHVGFYRQRFTQEAVSIEVCGIEQLLEIERKADDLVDEARFIQQFKKYLLTTKENVRDRVLFKDLFSLFLLVSQGGYFFDSNVFPQKNRKVSVLCESDVAMARSDFEGVHDYFIMYSPKRMNTTMLKILRKWIEKPDFGNLNVFKAAKVSYLDYQGKMGVEKHSYKSYENNALRGMQARGLFYFFDWSLVEFEENLRFGDINQQISYPGSVSTLERVSLCYLHTSDAMTKEILLSVEFKTKLAYIASDSELYYVNKETQTCVRVFDSHASFFRDFPRFSEINVALAQPRDIVRLLIDMKHQRTCANKADCIPDYIFNVSGCTLLHHAVLANRVEQVAILLKHGAKLDLKATYQLNPSRQTLELTPQELAELLQLDEAVALFNAHRDLDESSRLSMKV